MRVINPTLETLRRDYEKGMLVLSQKNEHHRYLVVLSDEDGNFHCHRYFRTGITEDADEWAVSVDIQGTDDITEAFKWAFEPKALVRD